MIYEHQNFNVATHDILHELFGTAAAGYFHHLSKCFRQQRLVDKDGNDIYLPCLDKNGICQHDDPSQLDWVQNVDVPIYMFSGKISFLCSRQSYNNKLPTTLPTNQLYDTTKTMPGGTICHDYPLAFNMNL